MFLFFEILEISTDVTGAFDEICFSSLNIFAFSATKDLFFFISKISTRGKFRIKIKFILKVQL